MQLKSTNDSICRRAASCLHGIHKTIVHVLLCLLLIRCWRTLQDMGFSDRTANIRALQAVSGNVNAAVERLLSGM